MSSTGRIVVTNGPAIIEAQFAGCAMVEVIVVGLLSLIFLFILNWATDLAEGKTKRER